MQVEWMSFSKRTLTAAALLLSGWGFTAAAVEEPPVAPVPPPALPDKPAIALKALDEDFSFDPNNRRDPFTFIKSVVDPNALVAGVDAPIIGANPPEIPKEVLEKKRSAADLACNLAEASLMELEPNAAIQRCDQGMEEFKDIPDVTKYPELEVVKGRLMRARKASDQMRNRQSAERDFGAMNIKIAGVTVLRKNSQAIINSKIVRKGDLVSVSSDAADVMVDEIMPERVVFMYRGYRMSLLLSDAGGK